jgi:hypothetical protein
VRRVLDLIFLTLILRTAAYYGARNLQQHANTIGFAQKHFFVTESVSAPRRTPTWFWAVFPCVLAIP